MLKRFCPCCNNVLINYNQSYCERCLQKKKENRKGNRRDYFKTYNENRDEIYDFYSSKEWRTIREVIKLRDLGLCQVCLQQKILTPMHTVHHIIELKEDYSLRTTESNLICVCSTCHHKIHRAYDTDMKEEMVKFLLEIVNKK